MSKITLKISDPHLKAARFLAEQVYGRPLEDWLSTELQVQIESYKGES